MMASLKLLFRYLINMGILRGALTFFQLEFLKRNQLQIKGIPFPVKLRPNSSDVKVFHEVFLYNSFEFPVKNINIIIDAGANIGLSSLSFIKKFVNSKIIAVEPEKSNYDLLKSNSEHYHSIIPLQAGLWNKDTTLKINDYNENKWAFEVTECMPGETGSFPGISISSLMEKFGLEYIDLLKLDIEGSEKEIFADNFDYWIRRTKNIILELHDWRKEGCSKTVFGTIAKYNFNTTILNGMLLMVNQDLS
jgi:FkbM family methyltransferase